VPGGQPKQTNIIKLNTNEIPFPPSPHVEEILQSFAHDHLRRYPDPDSSALKGAIADYYKIDTRQVFVGNGSDEVLAHSFAAFFCQDKPILTPQFSYSFYPVYCQLYGVEAEYLPLAEDFAINLDDYKKANGGIIFANPNAPTGRALALDEIEALLQANTESVVIVDEAYVDFGAESAVALIDKYPNCLVIQTFSKSRSLAGMRVGFALGDAALIEGLERVKNSFNSYPLDMLAQQTAQAAMEDVSYFEMTRQQVIKTRSWTVEQMQALGFKVLPSATNFIFTTHPEKDAAELMAAMREKGLIIRHFTTPGIEQYLRISIGSQGDMETFIRELTPLIQG